MRSFRCVPQALLVAQAILPGQIEPPSTLVEQVIQQSVKQMGPAEQFGKHGAPLAWLVASEGYRGCMTVWRQPLPRRAVGQNRYAHCVLPWPGYVLSPLHARFTNFMGTSRTGPKLAPHSTQGGVF